MSLAHDLQFTVETARAAGKVAMDHWGQVARLTKTHSMTTDEAVTEADRATQRLIVAALRKRFPGEGIIGEENDTGSAITAEIPDPMGRTWVIDPIDGTNNYINGYGTFAVCIGLLEKGRPILGVVYDVARDAMYAAATGEGAWLGSKRLQVQQTPLADSSMLMLTSNLIDKAGRCPAWACKWIGQTNWKVRMLGSAAMEAIHVASGVAHGAVTVNGKLWDVAAAAAVVLEAEGVVTDLKGQPIFPFKLDQYSGAKVPFLAAAPAAHSELVRFIARNP
jgi:myo-inositol-1(or 4)-monophosphatase